MSDRKLYLRLGLEPGAPPSEVKRAFRNLSLKLHPDASRDGGTAERFLLVARAYEALSEKAKAADALGSTSARGTGEALGAGAGRARRPVDGSHVTERPAAGLPVAGEYDLFELGSELESSPEPQRRKAAARKIGLSGKRSAWAFLRKGLADPSADVVEACVRAASVLGLAQGAGEVALAYERAGPSLRDAILEIAAETGDGLFEAALRVASGDADPRRRAAAARLLSKARLPPA